MKATLIVVALAIAVAAAWLGAAGFARLRAPLDRLHCVTFVNAVGGAAVLGAALLADGASVRAAKIALILALNLIGGAATSHLVGRALLQRQETRT